MHLSPQLDREGKEEKESSNRFGQTAYLLYAIDFHHVNGFQLQKYIGTFLGAPQKSGGCIAVVKKWDWMESNASFHLLDMDFGQVT